MTTRRQFLTSLAGGGLGMAALGDLLAQEDPLARDALGDKYGRESLRDWLRESLPVAIALERELASA